MTIARTQIQNIVIELYKIFQEQEKLNEEYKKKTDELNYSIVKIQKNCPWHTKHNTMTQCQVCGYLEQPAFDRT